MMIDNEDEAMCSEFTWYVAKRGPCRYYCTNVILPDGKHTIWYLHRLLMGFPNGPVDHINGDGLDNRRENLRVGKRFQDINRVRSSRTTKILPLGVGKQAGRRGFRARIVIDGKEILLGCFKTVKEARAAYVNKREEIGVPVA